MTAVLADTHSIIWYLFDPAHLSPAADAALSGAIRSGASVLVSAISVIEVRYLVEKNKLPPTTCDDLVAAIRDPAVPVEVVPVDLEIACTLASIPRSVIPDLPDRIIAATSVARNLPLVTRDRKIQAASIQTIW